MRSISVSVLGGWLDRCQSAAAVGNSRVVMLTDDQKNQLLDERESVRIGVPAE